MEINKTVPGKVTERSALFSGRELAHLVYGIEGDLEKGETLPVNYNGLIPVLIEAVKDLKAEKDALESRVAAIESVMTPTHSGFSFYSILMLLAGLLGGYGLVYARMRKMG